MQNLEVLAWKLIELLSIAPTGAVDPVNQWVKYRVAFGTKKVTDRQTYEQSYLYYPMIKDKGTLLEIRKHSRCWKY